MDGDGDLDFFIPTEAQGHFLLNLGPCDPNCDPGPNCNADPAVFEMVPMAEGDVGLTHTAEVPSEGFQFHDLDRDGDLDAVFNHRIYQNNTTTADDPIFTLLEPNESGLGNLTGKDEGLLIADIDMDGDDDIVRTLESGSGFVNANRGDGTFGSNKNTGRGSGAGWGAGLGDMDNDGDLDLSFGGQFIRNTLIETVAAGNTCTFGDCLFHTTCIFNGGDCSDFANMLPGFADVDRDGDLDCAQVFYAANPHRLLRNRLYSENCAESAKRYVNIRPVRGLGPKVTGPPGRDWSENEFGARIELVLRNNPLTNTARLRRVQCTSSAGGYLNQHEYQCHFGLPPDPDPNDPSEDLHFDLYVDFPSRENEASAPEEGGLWRVDWTVNPQLANINLADLYVDPNDPNTFGRPIIVYRDGRVRFKGADPNAIADPNVARLYTLGGPLRLPSEGSGSAPCVLPCPTSGDKLAGFRFTKDPNTDPLWIREIIVDGQLDQGAGSGCDYNVVVLDVTDPNNPEPIGRLKSYTFPDNNRTFIPVPPESDPNDANAFALPSDNITRTYEVRVRVTSYRSNVLSNLTALDGPLGISISGGLQLMDSSGNDICSDPMTLQNILIVPAYTTPVKVRISRKAD